MKLNAQYLKHYKHLATLLWKYGRSDIVSAINLEGLDQEALASAHTGQASPDELANDLEAMGPTYVKLGQVLSSRPDLLPAPYILALSRLQDGVQPFSFAEVEAIVAEELGVRMSKAFQHFEAQPIAAASLGQVHSAVLRNGREVVVKVQRPGIEKQINEDMEVLGEIAEWLDTHTEFGRRHRLQLVIEEFRLVLRQELDYQAEANNLRVMAKNLAPYKRILVPQAINDYSTRRVLTMDHVRGRKISALGPLAHLEMPGDELAEELFAAYLQQVLVDGLFHADPHPGNVFLTYDHRIALLDFGMVGTVSPKMQENLLKVLIATSEGKSEDVATVIIGFSECSKEFDEASLRRSIAQVVSQQRDRVLGDINVGTTILKVTESAAQDGLWVPSELTLLGKTLMQLDQIGKILSPTFDPNAAVRRNASQIMTQRMHKQTTEGSFLSSILEMRDFVTGLPSRLNKVMDAVGNSELELKVRVTDATLFMAAIQKVANRITAGVILAALIVGASLLMQVQTPFQLWGYPGLAILCFLAAAAGGFWLVVGIFLQDYKDKKKSSR